MPTCESLLKSRISDLIIWEINMALNYIRQNPTHARHASVTHCPYPVAHSQMITLYKGWSFK
jgi:hypothetical protein